MHSDSMLHNQRGAAMVISLLALVMLTLVGTLFLAQTKTETQISGHHQRGVQALSNAEAGYGEVLARMSNAADTANYIGEPGTTVSPGWGRYVVLAGGNSSQDRNRTRTAGDGLDNNGDGTVDESGEVYPEVLTRQGSDAINYPWAQVRYKLTAGNQVVLFGDHDNDLETPPRENLIRGYPMIVATAEGGQGSARRTVEIEALKMPFQIMDSAIYAEDDQFHFNGTQFLVSGQDWDPYTETVVGGSSEVSGILTTGDPDDLTGGLNALQQDNVEGDGGEPSVEQSPLDMDLQGMADTYSSMAEHTIDPGTYSNVTYGDIDHYTVVHCTGDMHISGALSGGGILIVDGDFDCSGSFTWYGMIIVLGDVRFTGGGSEIHIFGSVLVQGSSGNGQTVSGNADIFYSSIALTKLNALTPYLVTNWREL